MKTIPETLDICHYIAGKNNDIDKLYFSPSKYPPPGVGQWSDQYQPWANLKRDLEFAALSCSNTVTSNGCGAQNKNNNTIR